MLSIMLLILAGTWPLRAQIPLLKIHSNYRVVNIQPKEHGFGIALVEHNPRVEENFVFFTLDTKFVLEIDRKDGSRKDFSMSMDRFYQRVKVGDIVFVSGDRNWDGQIQAVEVRMTSTGPEPGPEGP